MITLILFLLSIAICFAMYQFKEDQTTILLLSWAFCFILIFVMIEYATWTLI